MLPGERRGQSVGCFLPDPATPGTLPALELMGADRNLADIQVSGIESVTPEMLTTARATHQAIKLIARAEARPDGRYTLTVAPTALPLAHPLAQLSGHTMGLYYDTDINGSIFMTIQEHDPYPTAAAMLRDILTVSV